MKQHLLGNFKEGQIFVVSAPAGTGKTTLVSMLVEEFPEIVQTVSFTTRPPRPGEIQDVHYHFVSEEEFEKSIKSGEFLEYVKLYGYYYGTSLKWLIEKKNSGKHVVLVIDTQGAKQLMQKISGTFIFILPPSVAQLKERLLLRGTEKLNIVEARLAIVNQELEAASLYDYQVVNDDVEIAYEVLRSIFIAEAHKNRSKTELMSKSLS